MLPDPEWPANVRVVRAPVRAAIKPLRLAAELAWLPAAADHHGVELLHSLGTTAPLHGRAVRVTTVHDLIYEHFPGAFPPAARLGLQLVVPAARGARGACRSPRRSRRATWSSTSGWRRRRSTSCRSGWGCATCRTRRRRRELRARLELGERPVLLTRQRGAPAQEPRAPDPGGRAAARAGARARRACGARLRAAACARRRAGGRRAGADHRLAERRGPRGALPAGGRLRLPVAARGLRDAGAGGDAARHAGRVRGRDVAARGGRRRGAAVRPLLESTRSPRRRGGCWRRRRRRAGGARARARGGFGWERTAEAAIESYRRALADS